MSKQMTHTITLIVKNTNFSYKNSNCTYNNTTIKCRLLKNHIVLESGTKYKKDDGRMVGGHTHMGVYMERTIVNLSTLKEI